MNETEPRELELTPELLEYAKRVAISVCKGSLPKYVEIDDVIQEVYLKLLSKPPKFDPSKGTTPEQYLSSVVQYIVWNHLKREVKHAKRFKQMDDRPLERDLNDEKPPHPIHDQVAEHVEVRPCDVFRRGILAVDFLRFIDDPASRDLIERYVDSGGNASDVARQLGLTEGAIRNRLKQLAPKLLTAGFDLFDKESWE